MHFCILFSKLTLSRIRIHTDMWKEKANGFLLLICQGLDILLSPLSKRPEASFHVESKFAVPHWHSSPTVHLPDEPGSLLFF